MSDIIEHTKEYTTRAKSEDGKFYAHTVFHDDAALAQNSRIRSENILDKGKLGLHEGEDIRAAISVPDTVQWNIFKKKFKEVYKMLHSKNEETRMSGVKRLQIIHPEWVVYERL